MGLRTSQGHRSPSVPVTLLVALVQMATLTWVPLVHATGLDGAAGATVEDTHSADCSIGHIETWCKICALSLSVWPAQVHRIGPAANPASEALRAIPATPLVTRAYIPAHPTRAPPVR